MATPVAVGDLVAAGAPVLVLESMKMETVLRAPFAARVRELLAMTGSQVETGAPLVRLEPVADDAPEEAAPAEEGPSLDLPRSAAPTSAAERGRRAREDLAAVLMGFDLDQNRETAVLDDYLAARAELAPKASASSPTTWGCSAWSPTSPS